MINDLGLEVVKLMAMQAAWRDLAVRWELTWQERRALLPEGGEDREAPPKDTETRMRILVEVGYRLRFEDDDEMCEWLRTPSRLWRWHTPVEAMGGTLADLRHFRRRIEQGLCS